MLFIGRARASPSHDPPIDKMVLPWEITTILLVSLSASLLVGAWPVPIYLNVLACVTTLLLALYLPGSGIRDVACHVLLRFS